jgi:hypothetical protein
MELYTLDASLRRTEVVDVFESLIWTEKYREMGDFELHIDSTPENRKLLVAGTKLATNTSYRMMEIETITDAVNDDGKQTLKIVGPESVRVLEDRLAKATTGNLVTDGAWTLTGTPGTIARKIFTDICVTGTLSQWDKIPFIQPGNLFPAGTIAEPADSINYVVEPASVYEAIKKICDTYDMGFRLLRNFDTSQLYFEIYTGDDRTTSQTTRAPVVFAPELDNLQNTTELTTYAGVKNVAYVYSDQGYVEVIAEGTDPEISGFDRKVLYVKADNLEGTPTTQQITDYLTQKGVEELAKAKPLSAFEGEINQNSTYKYGVDYNLGDLVELRNSDGATNRMRVTEQIFVTDEQGDRQYPTLAMNLFITPGSWLAWDYNQIWSDLGLTEYWGNAP